MGQSLEKNLHKACKENSIQDVENILKKKVDINARNKENETALHISCSKENSIEIIKLLIKKGSKINAKNYSEETPLHIACRYQNKYLFDVVKLLVENGADFNIQTLNDGTVLNLVCGNPRNDSVKVANFLIEKGIEINSINYKKETPLHIACYQQKSLEIVKFLIEKGADINSRNGNEETPLHLACQIENSFEIVKFLVEKGADVNAKTNRNQTPLHYLAWLTNSIEIIRFLIQKGADINAKTKENETPLHYACHFHKGYVFKMIKLLVDNGADVNAKTNWNQTPLHFACQEQNSNKIIQLLSDKGTDLNVKTISSHETPLFYLVSKRNPKGIQILLMNDALIFNLEELNVPDEFIPLLVKSYSLNQDLYNLLNSNEFSDLEIKSNDSFSFLVHKLILLSRFNNDQSILDKFINLCKQKSKEDIQLVLSFLYSGFFNFDQIKSKFVDNKNYSKSVYDSFSLFYSYYQDAIDQDDSDEFSESMEPSSDPIEETEEHNNMDWVDKQEHIKEFFQEMQLDSKWIQSKKGRKGIVKDFQHLYKQDSTKDFTIICEQNKEIKVHKLILILRSELFKGMFALNKQDSSNKVHDYSKKSFETIYQLIYFFYNDKFDERRLKNPKIIQEFGDVKDYFQLNPNSAFELILKTNIFFSKRKKERKKK
ncbi:ankyrin repeat protein [Anaeramoeba ignava]|uniref:Ankyrin repeat protein n=1 Tax=Anaeramoeba ignava TaxID=1746090 RepID=A0A9Q0R5A6_ANAIG|nr:ankyrin repeat protein [Anaeramoeba ignava]